VLEGDIEINCSLIYKEREKGFQLVKRTRQESWEAR